MIRTGYFARARSATHDARFTKVHLFDGEKGQCLCGYKPHPTMAFQWCYNGIMVSSVECNACKEKHLQSASREAIMCSPLRKGTVFADGKGGYLTIHDSSIQGIKCSSIDPTGSVSSEGPLLAPAFRAMLIKRRFRPLERFESVRHYV